MTKKQLERYSRQICLDEIGKEGQQKLLAARVLIAGAGGLGSPAALYLAAAGTGTIGIADGDRADISNLQRQILHGTADIGKPKVFSAKESITAVDPDIKVETYPFALDENTAGDIIKEYDFILDCTDSAGAKLMINDLCVKLSKPCCHGGISGFCGQVMTYVPGSPCLRCLFGEPDGSEESFKGVIGAAAGIAGCIQAAEAVKYILKKGELLTGRIMTFDLATMRFKQTSFPFDKNCPVCGKKRQV